MSIGTLANSESGSSCRAKLNQALSLWDGMVGAIIAYGGSSAPSKWAICNGAAVSRTTYSELFAIVGTVFGSGNGSTTFNLPDLRGRVPVGVGGTAFSALGVNVGQETHTLSESELPSHSHTFSANLASTVDNNGDGSTTACMDASTSNPTSSIGENQPHNNIQPSLCVNYIIYTGV